MNRARGFTLVELLLATALSTLLLLGVTAVIASLGSAAQREGRGQQAAHAIGPAAVDAWVRLLREDMANASEVEVSGDNELTLIGHAALDPRSGERTHRPARVVYAVERIGARDWLVRRQHALDELNSRNVSRRLVLCGVAGFELDSRGADTVADEGTDARRPQASVSTAAPGERQPAARRPGASHTGLKDGTNVYLAGLAYYVENLPEDIRRNLVEEADGTYSIATTKAGIDVSAAGQASASGAGPGSVDRGQDEPAAHASAVAWRLRLWVGDQQPAVERLVGVR